VSSFGSAPSRSRRRALATLGLAAIAPQLALAQGPDKGGSPVAHTLRIAFPVAETGFDPAATSDLYSDHVQRAIFDTLYGFDYLARPYKRVPRTAAAMPVIEDGGRTWTFRVRPGIHFADDPVFKGAKRELTAADYVYAWKRLLDPRVRSPFSWYVAGKIVGADKVVAEAKT
jgi:ABC-type transport system substrate-binding protein